MKKQDAMQEIEAIRARLAELERIVQEPEVEGMWRPRNGESYWYVNDYMGVSSYVAEEKFIHYRIAQGNCFPTREAAEKAAPLFARAHKIIQAALMVDPEAGEWSPSRKYIPAYECSRGWYADSWGRPVAKAIPAHVHTREQARQMAAILNAEGVK